MISSKKKSLKRIGLGIIITIVSVTLLSFMLTKVIYDSTFGRYDVISPVPDALSEFVGTRQTVTFESGENTLQGYLYKGGGNGLVVIIPGYHAGADDYLWQIESLVAKGWGVFCFDTTGSCRSEGDSSVGFSQAMLDLDAALTYLETNKNFGYENLYLFGHSRGAYAVCGVLDKGYNITAAVTISGVNSCMDAVIQPVADKIGVLAYSNYPFLWMYQAALFGSEIASTDCAEEIRQSNVPTLIVQGTEDNQYTREKYSVYSHSLKETSDNVEYYICDNEGQNGHTDLLYDPDGTANQALMAEIDRFFKANTSVDF